MQSNDLESTFVPLARQQTYEKHVIALTNQLKEKEDAKKVIDLYHSAAEKNNTLALYNLGIIYFEGIGVKKDVKEALRLYRLAADQGCALAQNNLGFIYKNGLGVEKDNKEAVRLYRLAVNQGKAFAQNNLGLMYQDGLGVEKDDKEAVRLYRLAVDQGDAFAQDNLGRMYQKGLGVEKDYKEAVRLYHLAADQGHAPAQNNLGYMYYNGSGVEKDYKEVMRLYRLAADQGYAPAQGNLGYMYEKGLGVEKDEKEAVRLYRLAVDQGDVSAQNHLGHMYCRGSGVEKDYKEAVRLYRLAVNQGDASAQNNLGFMYHKGLGVEKDYKEAVRLYRLAVNQGDASAHNNLGYMYQNGLGVEEDYKEAARLCRLAADQGSASAKRHLESLALEQRELASNIARLEKEMFQQKLQPNTAQTNKGDTVDKLEQKKKSYNDCIQTYLSYKPTTMDVKYPASPEAINLKNKIKDYENILHTWAKKSLSVLKTTKNQMNNDKKKVIETTASLAAFAKQYKVVKKKKSITEEQINKLILLEKEMHPSHKQALENLNEAEKTYKIHENTQKKAIKEKEEKEQKPKEEELSEKWQHLNDTFQEGYKAYNKKINHLIALYETRCHLDPSCEKNPPQGIVTYVLGYRVNDKKHPYNLFQEKSQMNDGSILDNIKKMEEYNGILHKANATINNSINFIESNLVILKKREEANKKSEKKEVKMNPHYRKQFIKKNHKAKEEKKENERKLIKLEAQINREIKKMNEGEKILPAQQSRFFTKTLLAIDHKQSEENKRAQTEQQQAEQQQAEQQAEWEFAEKERSRGAIECKTLANDFISTLEDKKIIPAEEQSAVVFMLQILLIEFSLTRPLGKNKKQKQDFRNHALYLLFSREDSINELIDALKEYARYISDNGEAPHYENLQSDILKDLVSSKLDLHHVAIHYDKKNSDNKSHGKNFKDHINKSSHRKAYDVLADFKLKNKIQPSTILDEKEKTFAQDRLDLLMATHFSKARAFIGERIPPSFWFTQSKWKKVIKYRHRQAYFPSEPSQLNREQRRERIYFQLSDDSFASSSSSSTTSSSASSFSSK